MCREKKGRGFSSSKQSIEHTWSDHDQNATTNYTSKQANGCYSGRRACGRRRSRRWSETARTFLVLDLGLDVADGVAALDLERDRLPRQLLTKICISTRLLGIARSPVGVGGGVVNW
jgi:hypothetical protein